MNFVLLCFCLALVGQTKLKLSAKHKNTPKLNYQGCWSGADKALTYILFKGNTVQDTRDRKLFHFTEVSKDLKTKTVILKLKEERLSRRLFKIQFISDNEIMIGMPMFRDTCTKLP